MMEDGGAAVVAPFPIEFRSLEEDFVDRKIAINNNINALLDEGLTPTLLQLAQANVNEARRCMTLMGVEIRGKTPSLRRAMQAKINLYREELQGLMRDLERAQLMAKEMKINKRAASQNSAAQYERITASTDRLLRSSQTLQSSQRIVAETEQIGVAVLDNLASQRESLLSAHEKVRETREVTSEARRILQRMARRVLTNTIVLYTIIAILVISICFVLYDDFIKPSSLASSSTWDFWGAD